MERTQLTYYRCENRNCPHYEIPRQIRENAATNKPLHAPSILCDGSDGCNKKRIRMRNTTIEE